MIMREISNHILDILQNSVAAGATLVRTDISYSDDDKKLKVVITDNGKGMDEKTLASVEDPFSTSRKTRSVGLGIPLYKYHAILTGGDFSIKSQKDILDLLSAQKILGVKLNENNMMFPNKTVTAVMGLAPFDDKVTAEEISVLKNKCQSCCASCDFKR